MGPGQAQCGVRGHGPLFERHRLAGQNRFVDREVAFAKYRIRGHPIPFVEPYHVAADHVVRRDVRLFAVTDHTHTGRRQVPQGFERPLGLALLHQSDPYDDEHETEQKERLGAAAERQIDAARHEQHLKHRLGDDAEDQRKKRLGPGARQDIGPFLPAAPGGLGRTQCETPHICHRYACGHSPSSNRRIP